MNRERFTRCMAALFETFGRQPSEPALNGYAYALSDLPIEEVEAAVAACLREMRHMPRPVEIRERCTNGAIDNAEAAWMELLRAIRRVGAYSSPVFDDPVLASTVQSLGGWVSLCNRESEELHSHVRRNFLASYRDGSVRSTPPGRTKELPGILALTEDGIIDRRRVRAPYLEKAAAALTEDSNDG